MAVELIDGTRRAAAQAELEHDIAELDALIDEILLASRLDALEAARARDEDVDLLALAAEEARATRQAAASTARRSTCGATRGCCAG